MFHGFFQRKPGGVCLLYVWGSFAACGRRPSFSMAKKKAKRHRERLQMSTKDISNDELYELYQKYYKDEYFFHVCPASKPVQTKWTAGTNLCCITPTYDARTKRLLVSSVIDNIGKGAAGQAIQNMNIIFGLDETTGLKIAPMYP